jgi:hypothetical protein
MARHAGGGPPRRAAPQTHLSAVDRAGSADLAPLLEILDGVAHMEAFALAEVIAPPPLNSRGRVDGRTREARAWYEQISDLVIAVLQLEQAGLVAVIIKADGAHPNKVGITDAGRRYLADMRAL